MTESVRQRAGRGGKLSGHAFEHAVAKRLGLGPSAVHGTSKTKVDIDLGFAKASLKNPSKSHTQVGLYTVKRFVEALNAPLEIENFLDLFCGPSGLDERQFARYVARRGIHPSRLDYQEEVRRRRVLPHRIPYLPHALEWFNRNRIVIFDALVASGIGQIGSVDLLGWATSKDVPESVIWIDIDCLRLAARDGLWRVSRGGLGSTLEFTIDGKRLFHLQMKGSGGKDYESAARHGMMFHIYMGGVPSCCEITSEVQLRLSGCGPKDLC